MEQSKIEQMAMESQATRGQILALMETDFTLLYLINEIVKSLELNQDKLEEEAQNYAKKHIEGIKRNFIENYKEVHRMEITQQDLWDKLFNKEENNNDQTRAN